MLDTSILISPFPVRLQIGETTATFKVAAPRTILLTHFYITWSKTGDRFPATYSPLRKTKLEMVKGTTIRII